LRGMPVPLLRTPRMLRMLPPCAPAPGAVDVQGAWSTGMEADAAQPGLADAWFQAPPHLQQQQQQRQQGAFIGSGSLQPRPEHAAVKRHIPGLGPVPMAMGQHGMRNVPPAAAFAGGVVPAAPAYRAAYAVGQLVGMEGTVPGGRMQTSGPAGALDLSNGLLLACLRR
jgi:hypothetical protein